LKGGDDDQQTKEDDPEIAAGRQNGLTPPATKIVQPPQRVQ
jgi:hypothetical protein